MKRKLLILEDEGWFADSLRAGLEGDFEIKICRDPETIFNLLKKWWPDILLADVILGGKNLFVLLNEMQSYTDTRDLPVVILSAMADQIKIDDVKKYNVQKVLNKTEITPAKLREELSL